MILWTISISICVYLLIGALMALVFACQSPDLLRAKPGSVFVPLLLWPVFVIGTFRVALRSLARFLKGGRR